MTLKVRNNFIQFFFFFSLFTLTVAGGTFIAALVLNSFTLPEVIRIPLFLSKIPLAHYHFTAALISIALLGVYVPVTVIIMFQHFENTQSSEIIFFSSFLLGCLCDVVRIFIPLFNLGESYTPFLFFCGRIVVLGRLLTVLSLLGMSIMSNVNQRQDIERNLMIILTSAIVCAIFMPLNSHEVTTTFAVPWGFSTLFFSLRFLLIIVTFLSLYLNGRGKDSNELKHSAFALLLLAFGYGIVLIADNYLFIVIGTAALSAGTWRLLRNLHLLYMWK